MKKLLLSLFLLLNLTLNLNAFTPIAGYPTWYESTQDPEYIIIQNPQGTLKNIAFSTTENCYKDKCYRLNSDSSYFNEKAGLFLEKNSNTYTSSKYGPMPLQNYHAGNFPLNKIVYSHFGSGGYIPYIGFEKEDGGRYISSYNAISSTNLVGCPSDQYLIIDPDKNRPNSVTCFTCPEGEVFNYQANKCLPRCVEGSEWNPETKQCEPKCKRSKNEFWSSTHKKCVTCPPLFFYSDEAGACVSDCNHINSPSGKLNCLCQRQEYGNFVKIISNNTNYCPPGDIDCQLKNPNKPSYYDTPFNNVSCLVQCQNGSFPLKNNGSPATIKAGISACQAQVSDSNSTGGSGGNDGGSSGGESGGGSSGGGNTPPLPDDFNLDDYTQIDLTKTEFGDVSLNPGTTPDNPTNPDVYNPKDPNAGAPKTDKTTTKIKVTGDGILRPVKGKDGRIEYNENKETINEKEKETESKVDITRNESGQITNINVTNKSKENDYTAQIDSIIDLLGFIEKNTRDIKNNQNKNKGDSNSTKPNDSNGTGDNNGTNPNGGTFNDDFKGFDDGGLYDENMKGINSVGAKFDEIGGKLDEFLGFLNGKGIPSLNQPNNPTSCPITRPFQSEKINKDITWDLCKVLSPVREPIYVLSYIVFLSVGVVIGFKMLFVIFLGV